MALPRIIRQQMLDWLTRCIDGGTPLPLDAEIADRFNLTGVESARSLLADLADAGEIEIKGWGPTRAITLGRKAVVAPPTPRPTPSVVKRTDGAREDADVEKAFRKIKASIARGKDAVKPVAKTPEIKAPVAKTAPAPKLDSRPAVTFGDSEGAQPSVAVAPAPHPIVGMELPRPPAPLAIERLPTAPKRPQGRPTTAAPVRETRRQLNIHFPSVEFAKLEALASAANLMPGAYAREQMIALLNGAPLATTTRTIIPASIAAAAIRDGFPVVEFAHRMMVLGLAAYAHEITPEKVA